MKQIVCSNCGAKYKLPDSFKNDKAKCKACGSVIDVAGQVAGDPAPAATSAAKPASAKPAKAKPATARRGSADESKAASKPRRSGRATEATASDAPAGTRRGRSRNRVRGAGRTAKAEQPEGSNRALIGGGLLVVALAVVGLIWFMGSDDAETDGGSTDNPQTASANDPDKDATTGEPATTGADPEPESGNEPTDATADSAEPTPTEAAAPKPTKKKRNAIPETKDEVFNPLVELQELPFPSDMSEEAIQTVKGLVQAVVDGGLTGTRAKPKLAELGYQALPAIVNRMRELDYFDAEQNMTAFEFTRLMREMTLERFQVPAETVEFGEDVPLAKAHTNAKSVKHWHRIAQDRLDTEAKWLEFLKRAKAKRRGR